MNLRLRVITAALLIAPLLGCPTQSTIAALTSILGTSAANIAMLEGNATLAQVLTTDTAAAVTAVKNWKKGTPADEAIQALNIVATDLNLIPGVGPYAPLVDLAIGTVESILALLPAPTAQLKATYTPKRTVTLRGPIPSTAAQFKVEWNQLAPDAGSKIK